MEEFTPIPESPRTTNPLEQRLRQVELESTNAQIDSQWKMVPRDMRQALIRHNIESINKQNPSNEQMPPNEESAKDLFKQLYIAREQRTLIRRAIENAQNPNEIVLALYAYEEWYRKYPKLDPQEKSLKNWEYKVGPWDIPSTACERIVSIAKVANANFDDETINSLVNPLKMINQEDREFIKLFLEKIPKLPCFDEEKNASSQEQQLALRICDALIKDELAPAHFYYRQIPATNPLLANRRPFCVKLHDGLLGRGCANPDKYLPLKESPEKFFDVASNIVYRVLEEMSKQENSNAQVILRSLREARTGGAIPLLTFIRIANQITRNYNQRMGENSIRLEELNEKSLNDLPRALYRIRYSVSQRQSQEQQDTIQGVETTSTGYDLMNYFDLAALICEQALERKNAQRVITIGDVIMMYPDVKPEELQSIFDSLQRKGRIHSIADFLRETKEHSSLGPKYRLGRPGYGAVS